MSYVEDKSAREELDELYQHLTSYVDAQEKRFQVWQEDLERREAIIEDFLSELKRAKESRMGG